MRLWQGRKISTRRRASSRFKEGAEKAFRKQDILLKTSSAKDEEVNTASIDLLAKALELQLIENEVATFIKKGFDEKFNSNWNVIVGRNFGSHISCTEHVQLSIAKISVIIFKIEMASPPSPRHHHSIPKGSSEEENHSEINPLKRIPEI
ncbi:dlc-3 [Pristionchus pacificus]|nr:dlc-3 [Pristionchus pacificus]